MDWNRYGYSYGLGGRVLIDKELSGAKVLLESLVGMVLPVLMLL